MPITRTIAAVASAAALAVTGLLAVAPMASGAVPASSLGPIVFTIFIRPGRAHSIVPKSTAARRDHTPAVGSTVPLLPIQRSRRTGHHKCGALKGAAGEMDRWALRGP